MCEQLAHRRINQKFSPPGDPNFGGVWERLVPMCQRSRFATAGERRLTRPMSLVGKKLDARLLTPASDDPDNLEALTPNHFLLCRPTVAETLMPDSIRYVDSQYKYTAA